MITASQDVQAELDILFQQHLDAASSTTKENFHVLKERYPNAVSDYALLFIARHAQKPITKNPKYNGTIDTIAFLIENVGRTRNFWENGMHKILHPVPTYSPAHPLILTQVELEFGFKIGELTDWLTKSRSTGRTAKPTKPNPGIQPVASKILTSGD